MPASSRPALRPILMVLGAALCWGSLGTAYQLILGARPLTPLMLITLRAGGASLLLLGWCLLRDRAALRVPRTDVGYLVAFGLLTVTVFYTALILAFRCAGVALGTVLLYLAPAIVTLGAAFVYGERLTRPRLLALAGALTGAALVAEAYDPARLQANGLGIAAGLASAVGYALYSLLGKRAMARHPAPTVLLYNLGTGTLGLLALMVALGGPRPNESSSCDAVGLAPLTAVSGAGAAPAAGEVLLIGLVAGTLFTLVPISLYLLALRELPAGAASTIATVEPVVAIVLAWAVLGETLRLPQIGGAGLILGGVVLLTAAESRSGA